MIISMLIMLGIFTVINCLIFGIFIKQYLKGHTYNRDIYLLIGLLINIIMGAFDIESLIINKCLDIESIKFIVISVVYYSLYMFFNCFSIEKYKWIINIMNTVNLIFLSLALTINNTHIYLLVLSIIIIYTLIISSFILNTQKVELEIISILSFLIISFFLFKKEYILTKKEFIYFFISYILYYIMYDILIFIKYRELKSKNKLSL